MICEALNYGWIKFIDKDLRVGLDTRGVDYLQPDYSKKSITAANLVEKCFLSPAMALRKAGISLSDDEIKQAPWLVLNPLELKSQFAPSFSAEKLPPEKSKSDKIIKSNIIVREDEKEKWWYNYVERILNPNEGKYIKILHSFFNSQRNAFQDKVDEWEKKQKKAVIISIDDLLINKKEQDKKIIDASRPIHKDQLYRTEEQLKNELGQLIAWKVSDDTIDKSIMRRARFLQGLNSTTFKRVENEALVLFTQANTENWTPGELAKKLKSTFSNIYESRKSQAMTIARTEIGSVTEDARYIAFVMENIEWHEWLNAADEKVRDTHREEGKTGPIKVGNRFPITGLLHPLDETAGKLEEVINCRCVNIATSQP